MKRHLNLLRRAAILAVISCTLAGCEMMALDAANPGTPGYDFMPDKRPTPIKPKKGTDSKIGRPKLTDDLINQIIGNRSTMQYDNSNIEEPR